MSQVEDISCLERMCDLIAANEDRLVAHVTASVDQAGESAHAPRSMLSWRDSIRGLSDALSQAVYWDDSGYAEGPAHHDPVVAYGVVRARSHADRGVRPAQWLALLTHYRDAYTALVRSSDLTPEEREICCRFVDRVFDRFESGFCDESGVRRGSLHVPRPQVRNAE